MADVGTLNISFKTDVAQLINDMRRASGAVSNGANAIQKSLDSASRTTRNFVAGFATLATVKITAGISDKIANLEGRIRNATKSQKEFNDAYAELLNTTIRTGGELENSVEVFQRLSFVRDEINASVESMTRFNDTVQKLAVISGAGTSAQRAGLTQLGQSLSLNIVRAEEFNSIMENIPAVGVAIAKEFGVTTGQLRQLVINGKVLSEDVFNAILNQQTEANNQFEKMPLTIGRATNALKTQFDQLISNTTNASGASELFAKGIEKVSEFLKTINESIKTFAGLFKASFLIVEQEISRVVTRIKNAINDVVLAYERLLKLQPGTMGGQQFDYQPIDNAAKIKAAIQQSLEQQQLSRAIKNLENDPRVAGINEAVEKKSISKDYASIAKGLTGEDDKEAKKIKNIIENLKFQNEQMLRNTKTQELYNQLRAAGVTLESQSGQAIKDLVDKHYELQHAQNVAAEERNHYNSVALKMAEEYNKKIESQQELYRQLDNIVEKSIRSQINSWKDLGKAVIEELQNIIAMQFQASSQSSKYGIIGGLLQGAGALLGLGGSAGTAKAMANPNIPGTSYLVPRYARGGITKGLSIAGEAGPEAVVPLPDGKSIPVNFGSGSTKSGVKIDYVDMRGASAEAVAALYRMIDDLRADVPKIAIGATQSRYNRNPSYMRG